MIIIMGCVIHHHVGIEQTNRLMRLVQWVGCGSGIQEMSEVQVEQAKGVCLSGFEGTKQALIRKAEGAAVGTYECIAA